jgi:hypothetical protein
MTINDIWPPIDGHSEPKHPPPAQWLHTQASLLASKTDDRLVGHVTPDPTQETLGHTLSVRVPSLQNYTYPLVTIRYGPQRYPLDIINCITDDATTASDPDQYQQTVRAIIQSKAIQTALGHLLDEARRSMR